MSFPRSIGCGAFCGLTKDGIVIMIFLTDEKEEYTRSLLVQRVNEGEKLAQNI